MEIHFLENLNQFVQKIRKEMDLTEEIPHFDPQNGNEKARVLFILEAPGRKAVKSGLISFENPDQSARNFREQLKKANIKRSEIALWNIVPWYLGDSNKIRPAGVRDIKMALKYLSQLIKNLSDLKFIVLVGEKARRAHVYLSHKTDVMILSCHHPSPKVQRIFWRRLSH